MSQSGIINVNGSGTGVVNTLTGNSGGAVGPTAGNINVIGSGSITIAGTPGTSTLTVSSSATSTTLSPYIVGATNSDFTTISGAISAAIAAGANSANQINIYVKPKASGTYSENLTVTDGINIIGLCPYPNQFISTTPSVPNLSVQVTGTITCSGEVTFTGITFNSTRIIIADSLTTTFIKCIGCSFSVSNNQTFITNNASLGATLVMDNCNSQYGGGTGKLFSLPNTFRFYTYDSQFFGSANTSSFASSATFISTRTNWSSLAITAAGGGTFSEFSCYDCKFSTLSIIDNNFNTFRFYNSTSMSSVSITGSSTEILLDNCVTSGIPTITSCGPSFVNCYDLTNKNYYNRGPGFSTSFPYVGSEAHSFTTNLQTTDATVSTLASVTLNATETVTLQGTITAAKSDHTDACGGNFNITVRRGAAGAPATIGAAVINVNSSTTATFTVDNDGTSLVRIRVTGIAATTYNWVTNYTYQKVLTSS